MSSPKRSLLSPGFAAALLSSPHARKGVEHREGETLWQYLGRLRAELEYVTDLVAASLQENPLTPLVSKEVGGEIRVSTEGTLLVLEEGEEVSEASLALEPTAAVVPSAQKPKQKRPYKKSGLSLAETKALMPPLGLDPEDPQYGRSQKKRQAAIDRRRLELSAVSEPKAPKPKPKPKPKPRPKPKPSPEPSPKPPVELAPEPPVVELAPEPPVVEPAPPPSNGGFDLGDLINDSLEDGEFPGGTPSEPSAANSSLLALMKKRRAQPGAAAPEGGRAEELLRKASSFDVEAEIAALQGDRDPG